MKFLECDLEEIIFNTRNELLIDRGLSITGKKRRQLRIGNYGIADIVTLERCSGQILITVFELKKEEIGISAFLQASGYVKGIKSYLDKRGLFKDLDLYFRIVLIGKTLKTQSAYSYLCDILPDLDCVFGNKFLYNYSYSYDFDGIVFEEESGYKLKKEGF